MLQFLFLLACEPTVSTSNTDAEKSQLDNQTTDVVPNLEPLSPIESSPSAVPQGLESSPAEGHDADEDWQAEQE